MDKRAALAPRALKHVVDFAECHVELDLKEGRALAVEGFCMGFMYLGFTSKKFRGPPAKFNGLRGRSRGW